MKKIAHAKLVILSKEVKIANTIKISGGRWGTPNLATLDCTGAPVRDCGPDNRI